MNMGWPKKPLFEWLTRDMRSTDKLVVLKCRNIMAQYYLDLDNRQHGGHAQDKAFSHLQEALGMYWKPGLVKSKWDNGELLDHQK